jgi:hypothetical protein
MPKKKEWIGMVRLLMDERARTSAALERLQDELIKMMPRSSQTMSAMRQREITEFVVGRLDEIREGV